MKNVLWLLPWLLVAANARADIELAKEQFERDTDPIVAKVAVSDLPAGAKIRGTFVVTGAATVTERSGFFRQQVDEAGKPVADAGGQPVLVPVDPEWVIDAGPGEHTITAQGVWVVTRDVTVGEQTFPVLVDFGQYTFTKRFVVKGGPDPDPDPPDPPTPGGPYQVMFFVTADQRDNLPKEQRALFTSLVERQWLRDQGHVLLEVLDPTRIDPGSVPGHYRAWFQAVQGKTLPAVGIAPKEGGDIVIHPLPSDSSKFRELLAASGKGVR